MKDYYQINYDTLHASFVGKNWLLVNISILIISQLLFAALSIWPFQEPIVKFGDQNGAMFLLYYEP